MYLHKKWGDILAFYTIFEQLCNEESISPAQVRTDLGINQSTMASWKSRNLTPKAETIQKLADYFGVSVDYLLGVGQRVSATAPSRRISKILRDKKWSLQKLSTETKLPIEILRKFALGDRVEDGRDCLEKIADALHANPAYLMGWTPHEDDEMPYLGITEEMWRLSDNDPDAAHGLQQFAENEEYQQRMFDEENAKRGLAVLKYLEEMGFTVSGRILKSHCEDQINKSGQIIGQTEIADEIGTVLSKDGHTATFTDAEFEELQAVAKEAIEGRFYKKVLEQQKK